MATQFLVFNKTTTPVTLAVGDLVLPPAVREGGQGPEVDATEVLTGLAPEQQALVRAQVRANLVGFVLPPLPSPFKNG